MSNPAATRFCVRCLLLPAASVAATIGLMVGSAAPTGAQQQPPGRYVDLVFDGVVRTNGITYGSAIDGPSGQEVDLRLDLYEPEGDTATARPVFVFLFGGGFVAGDRMREPRAYCESMARRGYVSVAIDYRINQGNIATQGIPAAVSDARQAVGWLRANAGTHRLDPSRIAIGGSSAGAITSLFLAYTDVERTSGDGSEVAIVLDLWGGLYNSVNEMTAGEPPLAILHGTEDPIVPFSEAEKLRNRAEAVDIAHLYHPLVGEGHAPYMPAELMAVVAPFFYETLWPAAAPTPHPSATLPPVPTASATSRPVPSATPDVEIRVFLPVAHNAR